jgi:signal peptidase I
MDKKKVFSELRGFLILLLVITSMRSALADWNDVPTGSMKPTIQEGDRVVVNKLAYDLKIPFTMIELLRWSDPRRADIVVLFSPADGVRLVKRVVAVPGDRVELRDNQLLVNGRIQATAPIGSPVEDEEHRMTFITDENLGGRVHKVMYTPQLNNEKRTFGPITVPPGQYFVMGDNRDNSNDSRFIGLIPRRRIVGRATAVAFSLDRAHHFSPRFDRFFHGLQ